MNPIMLNHLVTEVQRYGRTITDDNGENELDPRTVEAFMTSGINPMLALSMADLMNTMERPMIGAETYTTVLNDFENYPYFVRANYDLEYMAMAFINIAKKEGWRYLQVVYHDDRWGEETHTVLRKLAAQEGICIVAAFALDGNAQEVIMGLRDRSDVQPVVLFLLHDGFREFMGGYKMLNATGEFQLLSNLGNTQSAIEGYEDYLVGMVSFDFLSGDLLTQFKNHLRSIDVSTYMTNPWMKEWYEAKMNCSFESTGNMAACGTTNMFGPSVFDYDLDTNVMSVIYGVVAIAQGLHQTLEQYCGTGKNAVLITYMDKVNLNCSRHSVNQLLEKLVIYLFLK